MNLTALTSYIQNSSLLWIIITLSVFKFGLIIYEKTNKNTLFQPIIIAYVLLVPLLLLSSIDYEEYFNHVSIIHFFLGPATVALAVPLYKNIGYIRSFFIPVVLGLILAGTFSILPAISILYLFDAQTQTILSMCTKSITAPIAIITSEQIGANSSLALGFIIITGILGAVFGNFIFKIMNIKTDIAKGFSLGLISHAIGIAKSVEISEKATAFGALAMGLFGILLSLVLPMVVNFYM